MNETMSQPPGNSTNLVSQISGLGREEEVILLGAPNRKIWLGLACALLDWIDEDPGCSLGELAATLNTGQPQFAFRVGVVAASLTDLRDRLQELVSQLSRPSCGSIRDPRGSYFAPGSAEQERQTVSESRASHRLAVAFAEGRSVPRAVRHHSPGARTVDFRKQSHQRPDTGNHLSQVRVLAEAQRITSKSQALADALAANDEQDRDAAMLSFLQTLDHLIEIQGEVMRAYEAANRTISEIKC
jgi:hypothetical protein